ncbi:AraC family transcriptional regulator [Sinimarinibacterium thermocellulolyticum]
MGETHFFSLEGPLDSVPVERQMRTANLRGFADLVRALGADPRAILQQHGIDPRIVHDPDAFIDSKALVDVLEYCSSALRDPLFGLHLAQNQQPDVYGAVAVLCRAAATMREAIDCFVRYIPVIHSPVPELALVEGADISEIRWRVPADLGLNVQASLQAALLNVKLLRVIGGESFRPSYVHLTVPVRSLDVPEIERMFGCTFRAHMPNNAIAFASAVLDRPVASANRTLFRLLYGYLDRVRAASRRSLVERVQDYVRGALPQGNCSIEHCAKKLGVSVRALQMSLGEHGLRFSDMLEALRIDMAKARLRENVLSIDAIAAMLGYSDRSSFGRAFKRWTGMPPQRFRREAVQDMPARDTDGAHTG